jgi:NAD-dependent deacetylase
LEVHGDLHDLRCTACRFRRTVEDYQTLAIPPKCPHCGAMVRPEVVLFGETLPEGVIDKLYAECSKGFDAVFAVGTTAVFPYINGPVRWARQAGSPTIEINPGQSEISDLVEIRLPLRAAEALEEIWGRFRKRRDGSGTEE